MSNLFDDDDFDFGDDEPAAAPDWLSEYDEDVASPPVVAPPPPSSGVDLDRLREKSTRAGAMDTALGADAVVQEDEEGSSGFLSRLSPAQRLIIGVFFLVDVCMVGVAILLLFRVL